MIEEKYIDRLKERDEALKMGFELVLLRSVINGKYRERIKMGNYFVAVYDTKSFIQGNSFSKGLIADYETIPWFDIQALKMRDMTPLEMALFCRDNNYIGVSKTDVTTHYHIVDTTLDVAMSHSYIDNNGDEQKFEQVKEKINDKIN